MEYVNSQTYYHIQAAAYWNKYPIWQVGDSITIGQGKNPYFAYFDEFGGNLTNPNNGRGYSANAVASLVLMNMDGQPKDPDLASFYHYDPLKTLVYTRDILNHYTKFARETVYEEVRKQNFPELPSRQRCLWAIPDDVNTADYIRFWWPQLNLNNRRILKLELSGKLHRANQEFLLSVSNPLNFMRQYAYRYWIGEQGTNINEVECLFEGVAKVIDIIDPQVYGVQP